MAAEDAPSVTPSVVLLDLDGVVWLAHRPIRGSVAAIAALREAGVRVLFVTNNSFATLAMQEEALDAIGVPATGDVLTSAMAAASLVAPGSTALVAGGPGVIEALSINGVTCVSTEDEAWDAQQRFDAVVVGFHRTFAYEGLRRAAAAVLAGAQLIGTNDDPTYPTPDGPIPGGGAIVAAVETAAGRRAVLAGKPHGPMADLVQRTVGVEAATSAVMVGDRGSTDGGFARRLGCRFAQVWSGVTAGPEALDQRKDPVPDLSGDDLAAVARQLLRAGS
jgi:HAD superfamily hydrolase (TIGR01450 family)